MRRVSITYFVFVCLFVFFCIVFITNSYEIDVLISLDDFLSLK